MTRLRGGLRRLARALVIVLCALMPGAMTGAAAPPPSRIVSTSPGVTETLFALGLGDRVVGVSTFCRYPESVLRLPKVGTFLDPDPELIAGLRPDLVVMHAVATDLQAQLARLRIPTVVVERGDAPDVFATIRQIGAAAGVADRAEQLVRTIETGLARVGREAAAQPRRRVLLLIGRRPGTLTDLVAVGRDAYLNRLIGLAGGVNVMATDGMPAYPGISMETVLRLDPEIIIDTVDVGDTADERGRRGPINERLWQAYGMLTAVRTGRVYAMTTDALVVPGPRIVDAARWLAAIVRGERPR
jgi:iron complex transport system substrate-binding protein